jgi:hypothetical protein
MKQLIMRNWGWWAAIVIIASCSSPKSTIVQNTKIEFTKEEILRSLKARSINYSWLNGKAKTKIESPQENASGLLYLRNQKDSLIWLLIKKRSVEASRILLNPDSLFVIYRLEQTYEKKSIEEVSKTLNLQLNFNEIQDIISSNVPIPEEQSIQLKKTESVYELIGQYRDIEVTYALDTKNLQLVSVQYADKNGRKIISKYGNYKVYAGKGEIPYFRSYEFSSPGKERTFVELEIIELEFDKPERILFSIPPHYEEVY